MVMGCLVDSILALQAESVCLFKLFCTSTPENEEEYDKVINVNMKSIILSVAKSFSLCSGLWQGTRKALWSLQ